MLATDPYLFRVGRVTLYISMATLFSFQQSKHGSSLRHFLCPEQKHVFSLSNILRACKMGVNCYWLQALALYINIERTMETQEILIKEFNNRCK